MNNEQLIKQVDELIGMHRQLKTDGNAILSNVRSVLSKKSSDDYERGLNDAWELARKIGGNIDFGGYTCAQMYEIFDSTNSCTIFDKYSCQEALAKLEEYAKKKAAMPVIGDVVKVVDNADEYNTYYGVYLGVYNERHYIMERDCCAPTCFSIAHYTLKKMGQHIDLEGWTLND